MTFSGLTKINLSQPFLPTAAGGWKEGKRTAGLGLQGTVSYTQH